MAARAARNLVLTVGATAIAGVRVIGIKYDSTPIDITNADHDGIRKLLAGASASASCTITVSGVTDDNVLRLIASSPSSDRLLPACTLLDPGAPSGSDLVTCDLFLTSYEDSGNHDGPVEFSATLESSGAWAAT